MSLLTPDFGLLFWMLICFCVVFFLLAKFGFPVIVDMVEKRRQFIEDSLNSAKEANEKLASIVKDSEEMIKKGREEETRILKEANEMKAKIISDAKVQAQAEVEKILADSKKAIEKEREEAMKDINNTIAEISLDIAEKVIRGKLNKDGEQRAFVDKLILESNKVA